MMVIEDEPHVELAKDALRSRNRLLTDWEINFLALMVHMRFPSPRQLETLDLLVAKAKWKPRLPQRRRRGAGR